MFVGFLGKAVCKVFSPFFITLCEMRVRAPSNERKRGEKKSRLSSFNARKDEDGGGGGYIAACEDDSYVAPNYKW